ncbi:ABC-three component system middle component 6 [Lonsdalea quercina]|uniref:ABC-three component system middle component 6 n=1 Tax=Lonsdalea quercina TaxID=71657 RepID=UPI00397548A8
MRLNLFSKNEDLEKSAPVLGAKILTIFEKKKSQRVSIFEVIQILKKDKKIGVRAVYYAIIFLYSLDLIEFDEPYLVIKNDENK